MELYNFKDFLEQIEDLDWHEIIEVANAKCSSLERGSYSVKGAVKKRESGSIDLAEKIKGVLLWLQSGVKPVGLTDSEFQMLRPLRVKLIEKNQLKKNEIIVLPMTTPDFLPAMKKASAFITDEGGITCHAAIVARELKKPCITGTKIATKVLKDGMEVEVDADKGVVRIISSSDEIINKLPYLSHYTFTKRSEYNFYPFFYLEAAAKGYTQNPFIKKRENHGYPASIITLQDTITVWIDKTKKFTISDTKKISEIIKTSQISLKDIKKFIDGLKNINKQNSKELIRTINLLNKKVTELYYTYKFFADECFETANKNLIKKLPEFRWNISEYVEEVILKLYDEILNQIHKNKGITRDIINRSTTKELATYLKGGKPAKLINDPDRPIAIVMANNQTENIIGQDCINLINYLEDKDPDKQLISKAKSKSLIKGSPVYGGLISGRVTLLSADNYDNLSSTLTNKKGYILVTPMTRPEIVPYLKNIKAIVTDEGGITCHAAIVSRELKIPCITGTKIATKVLKDGMEVEVDADKGIVKILEK